MRLDPEVRSELLKMARDCLILSLVMALGFLVLGRLNAAAVYGLLIGYVMAVGNFCFLSVGVTRALETGDETAAKRVMFVSRTVRTVVMLAVMGVCVWVWTRSERIHWLPVVAAAFYPRIVIGVRGMLSWYLHRKDPAPEGSAEYADEDEEEEREDEFEKFVGRFSKGPVPGEESKNPAGEDRAEDSLKDGAAAPGEDSGNKQ
ncbi:MAG: ATP synthase subunit I [Clostridia bacterium]|nr:ATP synthase subunit I [Clostridia bacterium]